ncbi:hypothetical protein ACTFIU_004870 [Dictyostelium citrinum]
MAIGATQFFKKKVTISTHSRIDRYRYRVCPNYLYCSSNPLQDNAIIPISIKPTKQSSNQSTNQPINKPNNQQTKQIISKITNRLSNSIPPLSFSPTSSGNTFKCTNKFYFNPNSWNKHISTSIHDNNNIIISILHNLHLATNSNNLVTIFQMNCHQKGSNSRS